MFGSFQTSSLRIEVNASAQHIGQSLTRPDLLNQWVWPTGGAPLSQPLAIGLTFTKHLGPLAIHHRVEHLGSNELRLILSGGIDGFQEWAWGDGWLQSRLEGVSILPLNLSQTLTLLRLRQFLAQLEKPESSPTEAKS